MERVVNDGLDGKGDDEVVVVVVVNVSAISVGKWFG